jgi:hypothetical protein
MPSFAIETEESSGYFFVLRNKALSFVEIISQGPMEMKEGRR